MIESGLTYRQVTRAIGSKLPAVRQNYISYRILLQMEENEDVDAEAVEEKFSVLYLSLRSNGVQTYLGVDIEADPKNLKKPIPKNKLKQLANFALWLFGNEDKAPIISDSRKVDAFGAILEKPEAVKYLEKAERPRFEVAYRIAGGDVAEVSELIDNANYSLEQANGVIVHVKDEEEVEDSVKRLLKNVDQLLTHYPKLRKVLCSEGDDA